MLQAKSEANRVASADHQVSSRRAVLLGAAASLPVAALAADRRLLESSASRIRSLRRSSDTRSPPRRRAMPKPILAVERRSSVNGRST
jgi:hypothetical protein